MRTGVSPKRIATGSFVIHSSCTRSRPSVSSGHLVLGHSSYVIFCHSPSRCASTPDVIDKILRTTPWQLDSNTTPTSRWFPTGFPLFLRKEVIQPHLPIRLPCYDFTPVIMPAFGSSLLSVGSLTSGIHDSHGVTGGVYKTRERIHRDILIRDY